MPVSFECHWYILHLSTTGQLIWMTNSIKRVNCTWLPKSSMKWMSASSAVSLLQNCPWWRHQMETFSALLALCEENSPVTGEVPSQKPVSRSFDVFYDLRLNKRLNKHSRRWWFETPSRPLWRHCDAQIVPSRKYGSHKVLPYASLCGFVCLFG